MKMIKVEKVKELIERLNQLNQDDLIGYVTINEDGWDGKMRPFNLERLYLGEGFVGELPPTKKAYTLM